jgi:hypothetical protein
MDLAAATRHFLQGGWKARALASKSWRSKRVGF